MTPGPPAPTIGIDLGGTNLRVAVVDCDGVINAELREATPAQLPDLVGAVQRGVESLTAQHPSVAAVGVGAAGMVDFEGAIHYAPNIPMFRRAPVGRLLSSALTLPVVVDNDANVAAFGELRHGAIRGRKHAMLITLGTGVGGGLVLDGAVYRGANGFAAEVGHWQLDPHGAPCACGEMGHWEPAASGNALGRLAQAHAAAGTAPNVLARAGGDVSAVDGHEVGDGARAGEADALAILDEYAVQVALGFVGLANILDPEIIVVSGGVADLGELLLEPVRKAFFHHIEGAEYRPEVPIVEAELGSNAGVVGAAAMARELVA